MRAHPLRLSASILLGTLAGVGLIALAAAAPPRQGGGPLAVPQGLRLAPEDAQAVLRRRTITPEFDSRQGLRVGGRDVSVSGPLTCKAGNAWRITVDVSQGSSREQARAAGMCTGTVQEWRGRVAGSSPGTFKPGAARACARLVASNAGGAVSDRRRWCRDVTLVSEAGAAPVAAAGRDDEDEGDDSDTLSVVALVLAALALALGAVTFVLTRRRT